LMTPAPARLAREQQNSSAALRRARRTLE